MLVEPIVALGPNRTATPSRRLRILVIATLFPNPVQPVHGVFVLRRMRHVADICDVHILAPIAWFPWATTVFQRYRQRIGIPTSATLDGLNVEYPRFLSIPRYWKPLDPLFLFLAIWWRARILQRTFDFDVIDAHLAWPDGYAALLLARLLGKPLTVTLRGHDINELPRFRGRRRQIVSVLQHADRTVAVAEALRQEAIVLGCSADNSLTISNGVLTNVFSPQDQAEARRGLNLDPARRLILSVGHLVERKGHHLIVEALGLLSQRGYNDVDLAIVGGAGEEGNALGMVQAAIDRHGLAGRVHLAGARRNEELPSWYSAASVMCLASSKEGWANVLLESLACGTPVVATNVWGTPEVICSPDLGVLVDRTAESIAAGLEQAFNTSWDMQRLVSYARGHSWPDVAKRVEAAYRVAMARHAK